LNLASPKLRPNVEVWRAGAGLASAPLAESLERVDPGSVAVAPADPDRVAAHELDLLGPDVRAHRAGIEEPRAGQLVDAARAGTALAEHLGREDAPVPIRPQDVDRVVVAPADLDR